VTSGVQKTNERKDPGMCKAASSCTQVAQHTDDEQLDDEVWIVWSRFGSGVQLWKKWTTALVSLVIPEIQ
ncbi:ERAD-associated E3 ubiquitin-protein ligase HRD1, partial [Clarias magur]